MVYKRACQRFKHFVGKILGDLLGKMISIFLKYMSLLNT